MNKILSMVFLLFGFLLFLNFGYSEYEVLDCGSEETCILGVNYEEYNSGGIEFIDYYDVEVVRLILTGIDYFDFNYGIPTENDLNIVIENSTDSIINLNIASFTPTNTTINIFAETPNNIKINVPDNNINLLFNVNYINQYDNSLDINYDNSIISLNKNAEDVNIKKENNKLYLDFKSAEEIILNSINAEEIIFNNAKDFNLNIGTDFNIAINKIIINNSENITINGFDYNKINTLSLPQNTNMISIKDSENITIQNFRLYSINGIRNNNLTYLDVNNSNAIIVNNNVFNDVNNALRFQDVNSLIISNSFFNVRKIFDNIDFKNSEIIFANNFLSTIYNLDNISSNIITLQTQDTNSVGPVLNNVNNTYNCIVNTLVTDYNRTIPMYYFANNKYVKTEHIPPCWGGNLYANKTLPEFCGNDCFNVLEEYSNNPVDLISNNIESIQNINISDKAPLLLRKEIYENITEISDLYLIMNINPIDKKELYNPNDDYNFQILIKPNPIEQEGFLLYNDLNFYFEEVIINNNIRIVLNELYDSSRTLICEFGGSCKLNLNFQALFEDLNFNLKEFEKISSGNVTVPIKLTYTNSVGGAYCLWKPESRHCKPSHNILSGIIIIPIEGSAPTIKTPDNNVWVVALLSISIIGIYLFGSRIKKSKKK